MICSSVGKISYSFPVCVGSHHATLACTLFLFQLVTLVKWSCQLGLPCRLTVNGDDNEFGRTVIRLFEASLFVQCISVCAHRLQPLKLKSNFPGIISISLKCVFNVYSLLIKLMSESPAQRRPDGTFEADFLSTPLRISRQRWTSHPSLFWPQDDPSKRQFLSLKETPADRVTVFALTTLDCNWHIAIGHK